MNCFFFFGAGSSEGWENVYSVICELFKNKFEQMLVFVVQISY